MKILKSLFGLTPEEIFEGNKIIADFMDYTIQTREVYASFVGCPEEELDNMPLSNLYYHSWEWLMCVVEKIETIRTHDHKGYIQSISVIIDGRICTIETSGYTSGTISTCISESKLESTWKACIEFIKWYNDIPK